MYAAIRTYRVTDAEELSRHVTDEFLPIVSEVPGFVAYYIVDGGDGELSSITICDDQAGIEASSQRAAEWVRDRISSLIESGPDVVAGRVMVDRSRVGASS